MAKHVLVALVNAAEGREEDFNRWYETHLKELLALPGFVAAQRYQLNTAQRAPNTPFQYLTVYEIETDDIAETIEALGKRVGGADLSMMDTSNLIVNFFSTLGPRVLA